MEKRIRFLKCFVVVLMFIFAPKNIFAEVGPYGTARYLVQIEDLNDQIKDFEDRIAALENQKKDMEKKFVDLKEENESLYKLSLARKIETSILRSNLHKRAQQIQRQQEMNMADRRYYDQVKDLWMLEMAEANDTLNDSLNSQLQDKLHDTKVSLKRTLERSKEYDDQLSELRGRHSVLKADAQYKIKSQDHLLEVYDDYVDLQDNILNDTKDLLVSKELEIAQARQEILEKSDDLIYAIEELSRERKKKIDADLEEYENSFDQDLYYDEFDQGFDY